MAQPASMLNWKPQSRAFDMKSLQRLAIWGGSAAAALLLAVLSVTSTTGSQRLRNAFHGDTQQAAQQQINVELSARTIQTENETRRLADSRPGAWR